MKEEASEYILGTNGLVVQIVGMTSITMLLAPTLEADMANVALCLGYFYQGLLECDVGTMRWLAQAPLHCLGCTNGQLLVGCKRR